MKIPLLLAFALTGIALSATAGTNTASLVANCRSFQLNTTNSVEPPPFGMVTDYFTTYSNSTSYPLHDNTNNTQVFSGEVRPRTGQTGVYEGAFLAISTGDGVLGYGRFTMNLPTNDSDGNGLPDFTQLNKPVNTTFTGVALQDCTSCAASVSTNAISGNFLRSSNQLTGTFTLNYTNNAAPPVVSTWQLVSLVGNISYTRGDTNTLTLTATRGTNTFTAATTFTVNNSNTVVLPAFTLTSGAQTLTAPAGATFHRIGSKYIANITFQDGNLQTSWPDYTNWVFEVTDTNDSDHNGVPDFSDALPQVFPPFFNGAASLGNDVYYLVNGGNIFGYYSMLNYPYVYHFDLGFEYFIDANNTARGGYLYDFTSDTFFYTEPNLFPYLYDFTLNAWLYYFPDANLPGRYSSNPRTFFNFSTGQFVVK